MPSNLDAVRQPSVVLPATSSILTTEMDLLLQKQQ